MSLKSFSRKSPLVKCKPNDSVFYASQLMTDHNVGTVLVEEHNHPVGMISDRDLVTRCLSQGKNCREVQVHEVMSMPIHTISHDASILDLVEKMADTQVRRICIVDGQMNAVAIVSASDVFELLNYEFSKLAMISGQRNQKLFHRSNLGPFQQ